MLRQIRDSKTPAQEATSWQPPFTTALLQLVFQYLDTSRLKKAAREEKDGIDIVAHQVLVQRMKKPTIPDIIKLFSTDDFLQVLPSLTAQLPEADQYTSLVISKLAAEEKQTVEDEITDTSGQLCPSDLISFLQERKGITYTEEQMVTALFKHRQQDFEKQIIQALEKSVDDESRPVFPQTHVPKLEKMLQGFCLVDQERAKFLLKSVNRFIPAKEIKEIITENVAENHLPVYVATYLVKHIAKISREDCERLLSVAYQHNLILLFHVFIEREDVHAWINEVRYGDNHLVLEILSSGRAKDLQRILMSSPVCLKPIKFHLNYLFWCCVANVPLEPVLQSQFLDELVRQLDEKDSIIHFAITGCEEEARVLQVLKDLIPRYPHLLNQKGNEGLTPLHCAVKNLQMKVVSFLLEQKRVDVEAKNEDDENVLYTAIVEIAKVKDQARLVGESILSKLVFDPNTTSLLTAQDYDRQTAVIFACEMGLPDVARQIQKRIEEIVKTAPDAKLVRDASINAPTQMLEGRKVSVLEYAIKTRSENLSKTLNLIVAGAEYKLTGDDKFLLEALTREIVLENRTDALEPFYQFCKHSMQEKAMLNAMEYSLVAGHNVGIFTQFVSTYKSFEAKELGNFQKLCKDKITQFKTLLAELNAIQSGQHDKIKTVIKENADLFDKFDIAGNSFHAIQAMASVLNDELKKLAELQEEIVKQQQVVSKEESDRHGISLSSIA